MLIDMYTVLDGVLLVDIFLIQVVIIRVLRSEGS